MIIINKQEQLSPNKRRKKANRSSDPEPNMLSFPSRTARRSYIDIVMSSPSTLHKEQSWSSSVSVGRGFLEGGSNSSCNWNQSVFAAVIKGSHGYDGLVVEEGLSVAVEGGGRWCEFLQLGCGC
ncbi:hypothetical protein AAHE18_05G150800 [Arachis hypogaea]